LPEAAPQGQAEHVSTGEQQSQLASSSAAPAQSLEVTAEPGCDASNDAAQQSETGNKG
jgi:hypothetical protein